MALRSTRTGVTVIFILATGINILVLTSNVYRLVFNSLVQLTSPPAIDKSIHHRTQNIVPYRPNRVIDFEIFKGHKKHDPNQFLVPNIVHYIWYNTEHRPLQFHHMLSILSAYKILNPDIIYFHTNMEPSGQYWNRVTRIPTLKINHRKPPITVFGQKVKEPVYYTSHSNVDRVLVLMEYGGIYLDFDVLVTKPFDELRHYTCTIGREQETKACGSVIVCAKDSPFLLLWINSYLDDYQILEWAYNTGQVPFNLAQRYPHIVHMDEDRINRPNFMELDKIWGDERFDWEKNFAIHLWYRLWKDTSPHFNGIEPNEENIKKWNATFGEMARAILYGRKNIMDSD